MPPLQFKFFSALTLIHVVLMFGHHSVKADFSDNNYYWADNCVNSTNSTSCSRTYEHVYNSLAKSENSFNIESALYPAKKPSSVRVFVNVYGPNKTRDSAPIAKYTWSISCLYVAVPDTVLGILSLGSILVAPRTKTLSIQIPLFCCNVSEKDDERRKIIKEMIEGALAALQDLAISPGIRDPTLNTAECVIEGDKMNTDGREHYIRIILLLPVCFVFVSCPLLVNFLEEYRRLAWPTKKKPKEAKPQDNDIEGDRCVELVDVTEGNQKTKDSQDKDSQEKKEKNKNTAMAVCILSGVLAVIGGVIFIIAFGFWIYHNHCIKEKPPPDIYAIAFIIPILIIFYNVIVTGIRIKILVDVSWCSIRFMICSTMTSYFSCWLLIGIMINPTWGLTVTLLVFFTFAAIGFAIYEYHNEISKDNSHPVQSRLSCALLMLTAFFLVAMVVLAGQSYNGRETADESLKAALLSVIGVLVSWVSWKRHTHATQSPSSGKPTNSAQTQSQPISPSDKTSAENGQTNGLETQNLLTPQS